MLTLIRTDVVQPTSRGDVRRLLVLTNFGDVMGAIENARDPDHMPEGHYELVMATMATRKVRGLWLPGTELFMHAGNYPDQLLGCWSPGRASDEGVGASRDAVQRILDSEGGYEEKKRVAFRCVELPRAALPLVEAVRVCLAGPS